MTCALLPSPQHLAQLNILADQLAKHALLCLLHHCLHKVDILVGDAWTLQVDNQVITLNQQPQSSGILVTVLHTSTWSLKATYFLHGACLD